MKIVVALLVFTVLIGLFLDADAVPIDRRNMERVKRNMLPRTTTKPPAQGCAPGYIFIKRKCRKMNDYVQQSFE